jgi:hypothetical protein
LQRFTLLLEIVCRGNKGKSEGWWKVPLSAIRFGRNIRLDLLNEALWPNVATQNGANMETYIF